MIRFLARAIDRGFVALCCVIVLAMLSLLILAAVLRS